MKRRNLRAHPEWDIDLAYGEDGERVVREFLAGMLGYSARPGHLTVEVKSDARYLDTQKLYIEYECLKQGAWEPSGIAVTKADYWAFVVGETVILALPTPVVRACYEKALAYPWYIKSERDGTHPTKGVAIPLGHLLTWAYMELVHRAKAA